MDRIENSTSRDTSVHFNYITNTNLSDLAVGNSCCETHINTTMCL